MTPLHPRFRAMLLKNRQNRKSGLTPAILHEYETLLNCYFMASAYFYQRNIDQIDKDDCSYRLTTEILNILQRDDRVPDEVVKKLSVLHDQQFINRQGYLQAIAQLLNTDEMKKYGDLLADFAKYQSCTVTELTRQQLEKQKISDNLLKAIESVSGNVFCNAAHLESDLRRRVEETIKPGDLSKIFQAVNDITCYTEIVRFRGTFMPAYNEIRKEWVALQKEVLLQREYSGGFFAPIGSALILLYRSLFGKTGYK